MAITVVVIMSLLWGLMSLWLSFRLRKQFEQRISLAADYAMQDRLQRLTLRPRDPDEHYVDGMGLVIGDITCQLNARSPFLRCAANPMGPCEGCRDYEGREYGEIAS